MYNYPRIMGSFYLLTNFIIIFFSNLTSASTFAFINIMCNHEGIRISMSMETRRPELFRDQRKDKENVAVLLSWHN